MYYSETKKTQIQGTFKSGSNFNCKFTSKLLIMGYAEVKRLIFEFILIKLAF